MKYPTILKAVFLPLILMVGFFISSPVSAAQVPLFHVSIVTPQAVSSGVITNILFDTKDFDTYNSYSTSTGRYVPPVAGYYFFDCQISPSVAPTVLNSRIRIGLTKNGVDTYAIINSVQAVTNNRLIRSQISGILYVTPSDYVNCTYLSDEVSPSVSTPTGTYFEGFQLFASSTGQYYDVGFNTAVIGFLAVFLLIISLVVTVWMWTSLMR